MSPATMEVEWGLSSRSSWLRSLSFSVLQNLRQGSDSGARPEYRKYVFGDVNCERPKGRTVVDFSHFVILMVSVKGGGRKFTPWIYLHSRLPLARLGLVSVSDELFTLEEFAFERCIRVRSIVIFSRRIFFNSFLSIKYNYYLFLAVPWWAPNRKFIRCCSQIRQTDWKIEPLTIWLPGDRVNRGPDPPPVEVLPNQASNTHVLHVRFIDRIRCIFAHRYPASASFSSALSIWRGLVLMLIEVLVHHRTGMAANPRWLHRPLL